MPSPRQLNHDSSILIVGAGTWGCSIALHLARRGYRHVTVLDPYPVPSPIAAGNDINKIVEYAGNQGGLFIHPPPLSLSVCLSPYRVCFAKTTGWSRIIREDEMIY